VAAPSPQGASPRPAAPGVRQAPTVSSPPTAPPAPGVQNAPAPRAREGGRQSGPAERPPRGEQKGTGAPERGPRGER